MGIGSGLNGSLGVAPESGGYGTYTTSGMRFLPHNGEDLKSTPTFVQGQGIEAGRGGVLGAWRTQTAKSAAGTISTDVFSTGMGVLLSHLMGSTTTPVQQGSTAAYLQTHALGDNYGLSLTAQVGVPDTGGTSNPYTLVGGKILQADFACSVGTQLTATWTIDGKFMDESQTLAAVSYVTATRPFGWTDLTVKMGTYGSETAVDGVRGVSVTLARPQDVGRNYAGAGVVGTKEEPIWNDAWIPSGSFDIDLVAKADFADRFAAGTSASVILEWKAPTAIASTYYPTFAIHFPEVFFEDGTPTVQGRGITQLSVPFTVTDDGTNAITTLTYMSTDTSV